MQRRPVKSAHISPPSRSSSLESMGSDEKVPRMQRRSLGVTNRIWLVLAFFVLVLFFTRYVAPSTETSQARNRHKLIFSGGSSAKPKNYLNVTDDEPSPFDFCPIFGPGDELASKYGSLTLSQTRLHLGSGARVQRVIQKALLGLPVTFSVVGGSISACHGAGDDPLSPTCYPARFLEWWNGVFPHPATEITNGAMRRVNSGYFGYCHHHHIPDLTDMIIIELDTDDDDDSLENFELLVRSLLLRPDQPAVIVLGHFSPQIHQIYGYVGPDHLHSIVSQFYDVPHISTKAILYPEYMSDATDTLKTYYADPVLANAAGHEVIADVLITYIQAQVCAVWSGATGHSFDVLTPVAADSVNVKQPTDARGLFGGVGIRKGGAADEENARPKAGGNAVKGKDDDKDDAFGLAGHLRVPPTRIGTRPSDVDGRGLVEVQPFCSSANDLVNPLPESIFAGSGWTGVHPSSGGSQDLYVGGHYWEATMPGSRFHIPVQLGAGDVGVYYLKEPREKIGTGSFVDCWVDDNQAGAKRVGNADNVGDLEPTLFMFDHFVSRGSHTIECKLVGEEGHRVPSFKIMGIFAT